MGGGGEIICGSFRTLSVTVCGASCSPQLPTALLMVCCEVQAAASLETPLRKLWVASALGEAPVHGLPRLPSSQPVANAGSGCLVRGKV